MLERWKVGLMLCGVSTAAWLRLTQGFASHDVRPSQPALRVLFPPDRSVVETGKFELICLQRKGQKSRPQLRVDGMVQPWERYRAPLLVARLNLSPGRHQLQIGSRRLTIFVPGDQTLRAPPGWARFRTHPPTVQGYRECRSCHLIENNARGTAVLAPRTPAACKRCHSDVQFEATHFHPQEPLASCQMCHALHGSRRKALLKKPHKELCAACHD